MWLQPPDSLLKSMQNHFRACAQMIDEEAENIGKQKLNGQVNRIVSRVSVQVKIIHV